MKKESIFNLNLKEIEKVLTSWNEKIFRTKQIFKWLYKKGISDFASVSDIPSSLRDRLRENFYIFTVKIIRHLYSRDGTEKLLLELNDGNLIEAVNIPAERRVTGCISTQVGCKFACGFCASGILGFKRNLSSGEMIEQALYLKNKSKNKRFTHLVFMGIGEPLDNYENVLKAIRIINSSAGLHIGARRITVSTCGIVPGIRRLAREGLQIELSISLHAPDDITRSEIMPINKKYPLKDLIQACAEYSKKTGRQITFEYVLIKGVNSDLQSAQKLSTILSKLKLCKVNLIPCNFIKELRVEPPNKLEILLFRNYLLKQGINATLRKPRGQDIEAACGQLRLRYEKK